jgi:hypothetical protein
MIDHHILNTATKNADAFRLSSYWHKPRYGKLTAGPIWDFDRAQGSTDGRDFDWGTWTAGGGTDFFTYPWYKEMFRDVNFWQAWIDRLHQLRQGTLATANIHARIDEFASQLNPGNAAGTPAKRSALAGPQCHHGLPAATPPSPTTPSTASTQVRSPGSSTGGQAGSTSWTAASPAPPWPACRRARSPQAAW